MSSIVLEHSMRSVSHLPHLPHQPYLSSSCLWLLVMQSPTFPQGLPSVPPPAEDSPVTAREDWTPAVYTACPLNTEHVLPGAFTSRCLVCLPLGGLVFVCPSKAPMAGDQRAHSLQASRTARLSSWSWLLMTWKLHCVSVSGDFICKSIELGWKSGWEWVKQSDYRSLSQPIF